MIVAGNDVARYAEELRLAIIEQERGPVLDYIQQHGSPCIARSYGLFTLVTGSQPSHSR